MMKVTDVMKLVLGGELVGEDNPFVRDEKTGEIFARFDAVEMVIDTANVLRVRFLWRGHFVDEAMPVNAQHLLQGNLISFPLGGGAAGRIPVKLN